MEIIDKGKNFNGTKVEFWRNFRQIFSKDDTNRKIRPANDILYASEIALIVDDVIDTGNQ